MVKKIFLSFALLLFSCGKSIPEWYLKTPENNNDTIYGVGAAANKDQAIQDALSNMKERIYTSVSSTKFIQDMAINHKIINEYKNNIKLQTPNIPIPNYQVEAIEEIKGNVYVIVTANKIKVSEAINGILVDSANKLRPHLIHFNNTPNLVDKALIIDDIYNQCTKHLEIERFYNGLGFLFPDNICTEIYKGHYNLPAEYPVQIINSDTKVFPILITIFAKKFNIDEKSTKMVSYSTQFKTEEVNNAFITGLTLSIMQYNVPKVYTKKCVGNSNVSKEKSIETAIAACLEKAQKQSFKEFFTE